MNPVAALRNDGALVQVTWPDGVSRDVSARWLFDHADDARDAVSGQRGHGALALETSAKVDAAQIDGEALLARFWPSGVRCRIGLDRLRDVDALSRPPVSLWLTPAPIAEAAPIPFDGYLNDDHALREALSRVARHGLAILAGAPDEAGVVEAVVARFGFVRETNYGRLFDVRIEPRPGNLAYTDQALDLHTDNPYRDPVPTLQLLHAITTDQSGGETMFVDGFAHAEALRCDEPDAFERLARTSVRFTFSGGAGDRWSYGAPVLSLTPGGAVETVRLNHRSLDLAAGDPAELDAWYEAYLAYYRRLHAPAAAYGRRLAPGEVVIFDNRRLLHGRRALTSGSLRWLQGCYADADGLAATLARLERAG